MSGPDRPSSWNWVFAAGILLVAAAALVSWFVPLLQCPTCEGTRCITVTPPQVSVKPGASEFPTIFTIVRSSPSPTVKSTLEVNPDESKAQPKDSTAPSSETIVITDTYEGPIRATVTFLCEECHRTGKVPLIRKLMKPRTRG